MNFNHVCGVVSVLIGAASISSVSWADTPRPLTADEMRKVVIRHTWISSASGRPAVMSSAEKKLYEQQKTKGTGQFREYYAPNGAISGVVRRSDFDARVEGSWRVAGNELCASDRTHRIWKAQPLRATANARWCYRFVYRGKTLMMAASRTPAGASGEIGRYFRPNLTTGNAVGR